MESNAHGRLAGWVADYRLMGGPPLRASGRNLEINPRWQRDPAHGASGGVPHSLGSAAACSIWS